MTALRLLLPAVLALFVASCATTPPKPSGPPPVLAKLKALGISPATYGKIVNHQVLTYQDIYGLIKKGVPSPVILTYIKQTHAPYSLTDAQLDALNDAGASPDLLDYIGKSAGYFVATERSQTGGAGKWKNDPYFNDPYYWGDGPFGPFGFPGEWYDPIWVDQVFL